MSIATEIFYVLPDNSTNVSCPSQPCATLSQYWLHNGTLRVVSNIEYHFLPGEHCVPGNMVLRSLLNFSIIGTVSNNSSSSVVVLVGCAKPYVINIIDSHFITITNVKFKHCDIMPVNASEIRNLLMFCYFSCKLENVMLFQYGFKGYNLIGKSYLHNIKVNISQLLKICCQTIFLEYYSPCA